MVCPLRSGSTSLILPPSMSRFLPPEKEYAGYIFDCDGTLADSMPIHYRAWAHVVERHGGQFPEDLFYSLGGVPSWRIVEFLNERYATALDPELIAAEKEAQYVEWIFSTQPIWEVTEFARRVAGKAAVAVASGGILPVVTQTLQAIQLRELFSVIVTSEQVPRGKPFPDMFLEAARRMEVNAADCLVLEDSPAGFQAATAAGMDYAVVTR
jgi:HAD superfamily hydrolase (TIGR01509 family)